MTLSPIPGTARSKAAAALACRDCVFEVRRRHGYLSRVIFCVLLGRGLCDGLITFQRSPTECGVPECDSKASIIRRPWPTVSAAQTRRNHSRLSLQ